MTIAVVGAGAGGLLAAYSAAKYNKEAKILLFDKNPFPGKKLIRTGSGRGNIGNECQRPDAFHGDIDFIKTVLGEFPFESLISVFREVGIEILSKDGYIYPRSRQAKAVRDAFVFALSKMDNVKILGSKEINGLRMDEEGFVLLTDGWQYNADKVILCCGGKAAPDTGSDGSGYALAEGFGHKVISPMPALVPLVCEKDPLFKSSKERMSAAVTYKERRSEGELQLTEYGISGIVVFQISGDVTADLHKGKRPVVSIDFFPDKTPDELFAMLKSRAAFGGRALLNSLLPEETAEAILRSEGLWTDEEPGDDAIRRLMEKLFSYNLVVRDTRGFSRAQVTAGGIEVSGVSPKTLESKYQSGLYICGEMLDVYGDCGGYNLQWAFSGGCIAGRDAARSRE